MRRFVTLNCLVDCNELEPFPSDAIQNLRLAVLTPITLRPRIQQALQSVNFKYHRTCSYSDIIRECNVGEGETLLMFWGYERSDTMSIAASSCSSVHMSACTQGNPRDKELCSTAQQTEISCRYSPGIASPVNVSEAEEQRVMRARIADSLTFSSTASSLLQPAGAGAGRSMSILGSVCALLLNKQGSGKGAPAPGAADSASLRSDTICRICFGGESAERLVRPCSCRGTIAAVHRSCLERWLLQAATSYCELCRHHYVVTRTHKWSWVRSVAEWARSGHARALLADAWRALALGACSVLGTARALHACDAALQAGARRGGGAALAANLFSSLLIGVIGALNGLLTTWMLLKIQEHQASWQAWRDGSLHVRVALAGSARGSDATLVAPAAPATRAAPTAPTTPTTTTSDRSTNVADPFMVALPYTLLDP